MNFLKTALTAAVIATAPLAASAAVLDFTTLATFTTVNASGATGSFTFAGETVSYTLTSDPANQLTFGQLHDGNSCAMLACAIDGLGVSDDEITTNGVQEAITLAFDRNVTLSGLFFLDLFRAAEGQSVEQAMLQIDGVLYVPNFDAIETFDGLASGFAFYDGLSLTGKSFTFMSNNTNDAIGFADYALAGVQVAAIPLPAGLLLLGGALGALGIARRRKAAA